VQDKLIKMLGSIKVMVSDYGIEQISEYAYVYLSKHSLNE